MEYIKGDYDLKQLALSIALEAIEQVKNHGGDDYEYIDQMAAGSEHATCTYKAIMLCANCCTDDAEELLNECGYSFNYFGHHASILAEITIQTAALQELNELETN